MPKTTEIAEPEEPPPSAVENNRIFAAFGRRKKVQRGGQVSL
jgi:hypothetical protein